MDENVFLGYTEPTPEQKAEVARRDAQYLRAGVVDQLLRYRPDMSITDLIDEAKKITDFVTGE